jgi:hypothetical protein
MTEEKKILSFSQTLQDIDAKEKERKAQAQQTQVYATRVRQAQVSDPPLPRSISPQAKGFTSIPNHLLDQTLKTLDVYDQAVLLRIYRLSRGFGKDQAEVGVSKLAEATNISEKQIKRCVARLIAAGLISKAKTPDGYSNIYICHVPGTDKGGGNQQTQVSQTEVRQAHNKESFKKKGIKGEAAAPDTKTCEMCNGMGVRYIDPLDYNKGTVKCYHGREEA